MTLDTQSRAHVTAVAMALPYNLTTTELILEEGPMSSVWKNLEWLTKHGNPVEPLELERIFRSTVLLYHHAPGAPSLDDCFGTAIIWERG